MRDKLLAIQQELKAPKNQYNAFGKYNYRSCEDILEAVKPLLAKNNVTLTISDEIKEVAGIPFVEASVTLSDKDSSVITTASAGIDIDKKGMDVSQTFGAASSYARKYALNGMFLIDDTKDADATNDHQKKWLNKNTQAFQKAVEYIRGGGSIDKIREKYSLSKEIEDLLKTA